MSQTLFSFGFVGLKLNIPVNIIHGQMMFILDG